MCVIIYLKKGITITKKELKMAWETNPDGGGISWAEKGKVIYHKGYMEWNDFYDTFEDIIHDTDKYRVIHFRITSCGETNKEQTHPFVYSNNPVNFGIQSLETTRPVFFMNGTITKIKEDKGLNDTATFIKNTIYNSSLNVENKTDREIIGQLTNAKWLIMTPQKVHMIGNFIDDHGIWYSNLNHEFMYDYSDRYGYGEPDYYEYYDSYFFYCDSGKKCRACENCIYTLQDDFMVEAHKGESFWEFIQDKKPKKELDFIKCDDYFE